MNESPLKLFVTCPSGVESLLLNELNQLGVQSAKETVTGVICFASQKTAYRICLFSRLANRVLLLLSEGGFCDKEMLYKTASKVDWSAHLKNGAGIRVDFAGSNKYIRHSQFGAQVVKDAIVDSMLQSGKARPNVDLEFADHRINVRLTPKSVYVSLDLTGESLHKRGYRKGKGAAPLKENLAAAILIRAKWPELSVRSARFVDPMCGSGTFLIEAFLMAANIAPGLFREAFGFECWRGHDHDLWQKIKNDALDHKEQMLAKPVEGGAQIRCVGFEVDPRVADQANDNIRLAGLSAFCEVKNSAMHDTEFSASDFASQHVEAGEGRGLIVVNPPYGMRMGESEKLPSTYEKLAAESKLRFPNWNMGILSSNAELLSATRLRTEKKYKIFNGPIECEFRTYRLQSKAEQKDRKEKGHSYKKITIDDLSEGALMVLNRLKKNKKKLASWLRKENISCYRLYDSDMPEYAAAIDVYGNDIHIQEYQAPKSIDTSKAQKRFSELLAAVQVLFDVEKKQLYIKTRKINKGTDQYQKYNDLNDSDFIQVSEGNAKLLVNLKSYLDTGLFLDHRPLRMRIAGEARGKRFLNLFSYTSSASVHAILAGAVSSTSVDMSNTYVFWSLQNFKENKIRSAQHHVIRDNVMRWLKQCRQGFDLIMLDPPSFSNSKKMDESFDVQRDHQGLITRCMDLLDTKGTLYFSNNLRSFKLDEVLGERFCIENITRETIDLDFQRNPKIHHCFKITHSR